MKFRSLLRPWRPWWFSRSSCWSFAPRPQQLLGFDKPQAAEAKQVKQVKFPNADIHWWMFYMFYGFYMFLQPQSEKGLKDPLRPFTGPCHSEAELRSRFLSAIVDGACGPNRGGFGGRFWFIVRWIFGFLIGGVKLIIGDNLEHSGTDFQWTFIFHLWFFHVKV